MITLAIAPALISGAVGLASSLYGMYKTRKSMNEARRHQDAMRSRAENLYNRRMNESPSGRADAQWMLNKVNESIQRRNRQAVAQGAVLGGGDAYQAKMQEANNKALGDVAGTIVAQGDARKDRAEGWYQGTMSQADQNRANMALEDAKETRVASDAVVKEMANISNLFVK